MVTMAFAAFVAARVCSDDVRYRVENHGPNWVARADGTVGGWMYGTRTSRFWSRPPELLYVILHDQDSPANVWHSSSGKGGLQTADGTPIELPRGHQLFEISGGVIMPREGRVALEEFKDFVRQSREDWSVEGLLEHARQMRRADDESAK
jgi:hypothetical protein